MNTGTVSYNKLNRRIKTKLWALRKNIPTSWKKIGQLWKRNYLNNISRLLNF